MTDTHKYLVEFAGTFVFLSAVAFSGNPALILGALAIAIGLGAKISGGFFNPAITAMMSLSGKLTQKDTLYYMAAQFAAAILVAFLPIAR